MTTAYRKQVASKSEPAAKPEPVLSFVAAVKSRRPDDNGWMFAFDHVPDMVRWWAYEHTSDYVESMAMASMERGAQARVDFSDADLNAYEAIRVTYDPPPIPLRHCDYSAVREGYEPGWPIGYGATAAMATASLLDAEGK